MNIISGLMDGQVLQRDKKGFAAATIRGEADAALHGPVSVTISRGKKVLPGFKNKVTGTCAQGQWQARLEKVPTGGKYTVEFRINAKNKMTVRDVMVGDVWFLAGQSNMQGNGFMTGAPDPHPLVHAFFMTDEWGVAREPVCFLPEAVDPVHNPRLLTDRKAIQAERKKAVKGVGPGLFFGEHMVKLTGVPQGLVACAHGGTSMDQWSPALKEKGGHSLYGAMLRRFKKLGQPAAGVLWYQGESDGGAAESPVYTEKMRKLVNAVRADFGRPGLLWVMAQIGRYFGLNNNPPHWHSIREQQRRLPEVIPGLAVVPTVDLELDDIIHIGAAGQKILGRRLARAASHRLRVPGSRAPIALARARLVPPLRRGFPHEIEVAFTNVAGSLRAAGHPTGFILVDAEGRDLRGIFKTRLCGSRVRLEQVMDDHIAQQKCRLAYGYPIDAFCNIEDAEGMGLPAFGPLPIEK
jgi:sialate O-acetylesterase